MKVNYNRILDSKLKKGRGIIDFCRNNVIGTYVHVNQRFIKHLLKELADVFCLNVRIGERYFNLSHRMMLETAKRDNKSIFLSIRY